MPLMKHPKQSRTLRYNWMNTWMEIAHTVTQKVRSYILDFDLLETKRIFALFIASPQVCIRLGEQSVDIYIYIIQ